MLPETPTQELRSSPNLTNMDNQTLEHLNLLKKIRQDMKRSGEAKSEMTVRNAELLAALDFTKVQVVDL